MGSTDREVAFLGIVLAACEEHISTYARVNRERGENPLPLDLPHELRERTLTLIAALDDCLEEAGQALNPELTTGQEH